MEWRVLNGVDSNHFVQVTINIALIGQVVNTTSSDTAYIASRTENCAFLKQSAFSSFSRQPVNQLTSLKWIFARGGAVCYQYHACYHGDKR